MPKGPSDFGFFWRAETVEERIASFTEAERTEILAKSPFEALFFQGEGFHVFRKDEKDFYAAYVTVLGEVSQRFAEDWVIARWLEEEERGKID
jgi:hypothetical protein